MYSKALYFTKGDRLFFFNSISGTNLLLLLPLRARQKEQVSACLSCPSSPSSPPIRLLCYLADVYQWQEIISETKLLWPITQVPWKQPVLSRSISVKVLGCECVFVWARTLAALHCSETPPALHSHIKPTRSPITPDQGYLKARMSIGSFQFCCRVCNGGGRSVPRDERISWNQEAVGLAKGYFLVKRFLNCRGDQRRWLSAPKAVYSDKHPAKRGV